MRYDLAFFLCCCKSFLGTNDDDDDDSNNYYKILQVDRDATNDELKRAYKKLSLQIHPDKLAQRGIKVTNEHQLNFTKMKEAYEILSDPHKRETYDTLGARGMKYIDEPFSIDPQELAHNFAKSSIFDRSKIFAIFVTIAIAILILPILICLHVDGKFGTDASWIATLTPLWIWDILLLFYHTRVIMMGPIPKPDNVSDDEWIDPLPMKKRIYSLIRFILIIIFEILIVLKLDNYLHNISWFIIFIPLYIWECTTLYKKLPLARMRIVTVEDLEAALGKPFSEFTLSEKELIGKRYSVVQSTTSPDYDIANKLKLRARQDVFKVIFRIIFIVIILIQIDNNNNITWNWWFVFLPFWLLIIFLCYSNYKSYNDMQKHIYSKDPTLFNASSPPTAGTTTTTDNNNNNNEPTTTYYGAVGIDGTNTTQPPTSPSVLTEEERDELKEQIYTSQTKFCRSLCTITFTIILLSMFISKLNGATFSSFWIISPFLLMAGIMLCCIGLAIFGVKEVSTDGVDFESDDFAYTKAEEGQASSTAPPPSQQQQPIYVPPPATTTTTPSEPPVAVSNPSSPTTSIHDSKESAKQEDINKQEDTTTNTLEGEIDEID